MNPYSKVDRVRLSRAMQYWYRQLGSFRRGRKQLISYYAGTDYGKQLMATSGLTKNHSKVYVNLIQQMIEAYSAALAYNDPVFQADTFKPQQRQFANRFKTAINNYTRTIFLRQTVEECIHDAFFCVGIGKVYLADSMQVANDLDPNMNPGMPFAGRVSLDNWVHDGNAPNFRRCLFMGDRYRIPLEMAMEDVRFDEKQRAALYRMPLSQRESGSEARTISGGTTDDQGELVDHVDLIDLYLSRERIICTWAIKDDFSLIDSEPLAVQEWDGAETGPYRHLSFINVPDNVMPSSPSQAMRPLFILFNNLFRKMANRAEAQKDVIPYQPGAEEDVQRALRSRDMQPVRMNDPSAATVMKMGGIDQSISSFAYGVYEMFKTSSGNLDVLAGLGPSSETATQDMLVNQHVGANVALKRQKSNRFTTELGTDIGRLMFDDPVLAVPGTMRVDGLGEDYVVEADWYPPDQLPRLGTFEDYQIQVKANSMEYSSPAQDLQKLRGSLQVMMPILPLLQQQGVQFNAQEYLKLEAELLNQPRLLEVFTFTAPPQEGGKDVSSNSTNQPREYIRKNVSSGPTSQGRMNQAFAQQPSPESNGK